MAKKPRMTYHDRSMLNYQAEHIRKGECWVCYGKGEVNVDSDTGETAPCDFCAGSGKATDEDRERLKIHEQGICLICKLPHVKGQENNSTSKLDHSGVNDCVDHLRQYVLKLEARLAEVEDRGRRE